MQTTNFHIQSHADMACWEWNDHHIGWTRMGEANAPCAVLLIHGFGANTEHWRFNQPVLAEAAPTYAIDLLGFGESDQPRARLKDEQEITGSVHYGFDLWGQQVADFCKVSGGISRCKSLPKCGADRLRPAIDGRQTTEDATGLDGLDSASTENNGAPTLVEHSVVPKCRASGADPSCAETGLSKPAQYR